jgi:hypothetical protein
MQFRTSDSDRVSGIIRITISRLTSVPGTVRHEGSADTLDTHPNSRDDEDTRKIEQQSEEGTSLERAHADATATDD